MSGRRGVLRRVGLAQRRGWLVGLAATFALLAQVVTSPAGASTSAVPVLAAVGADSPVVGASIASAQPVSPSQQTTSTSWLGLEIEMQAERRVPLMAAMFGFMLHDVSKDLGDPAIKAEVAEWHARQGFPP